MRPIETVRSVRDVVRALRRHRQVQRQVARTQQESRWLTSPRLQLRVCLLDEQVERVRDLVVYTKHVAILFADAL